MTKGIVGASRDVCAIAALCVRQVWRYQKTRRRDQFRNTDYLLNQAFLHVSAGGVNLGSRWVLTFENQFVFQKPGVPQGHDAVPPESRQDGSVKSFSNQKSIARDIPLSKVGFLTNWSAPGSPPCQAAAIVSVRESNESEIHGTIEGDTHGCVANEFVLAWVATLAFISKMEFGSRSPIRTTRSTTGRVVNLRIRPFAIVPESGQPATRVQRCLGKSASLQTSH